MTVLARERSGFRDGKRGTSWFSVKVPKREVSLQED